MAIDGAFLRHIKYDIKEKAIGCRVEKVYQPSKYEIIIGLRGLKGNYKLLISSSGNSARAHFTNHDIPNPQNPPMFCMLLRKKLYMAKFVDVRQDELERVLLFDFIAKNELGDDTKITIASEIMGKYSNIIIIENGVIVDAIKRVNSEMSTKRLILPKIRYEVPPKQDKICVLNCSESDISEALNCKEDTQIYKIINSRFQGLSCSLIKRMLKNTCGNENIKACDVTQGDVSKIKDGLFELFGVIKNVNGTPVEIFGGSKSEVSFIAYESDSVKTYQTFSDLTDKVYFEQDKNERINSKTGNIIKHLKRIVMKLKNKIEEQKKELEMCSEKGTYKLYGDLIMSNLHLINRGESSICLKNYYDENLSEVTIKLDTYLTGSKNAQLYYKKYKKACNAEKILQDQIEKSHSDIEYLESTIDFLSRAETEQELYEIEKELEDNKYIKKAKNRSKIKMKPLKPLEYYSKDGFKILVGRNSTQNDKLTTKIASKKDIWFHVKDIHGAHVILVTDGKKPSEEAIRLAANFSVLNSKACNSSNVAVDYTEIKNVKKPSGARPGMVNYVNNKTIYVTPTKNID